MATSTGFLFGPWACKWAEAFYLSPLSVAIVNLKPIVPGHVLVLSRRVVARFSELTPEEVNDLWTTVQKVSGPLQSHYKRDALTMAIQDGPAAGQTVPHVHVHVLPRQDGDFARNDQVYDEMDNADMARDISMDADEDRKPRTKMDMAAEAAELRTLYLDSLPIPRDDFHS